jgi:ABC-type phosphate transport system substrate-binding protein
MTPKLKLPRVPALLASGLLALAGRAALATDCATLPSVVYATGSTAAKPLLAEIGRVLATQASPVTVVYVGAGSCAGVDAVLSGTPLMGAGSTALSYWDSTGGEFKCDITAAGGVVADIGISDVFASTCFQLPGGLPSSVAEVVGPVQAMTFVTHRLSTEKAISAEAAYNIYGFGAMSGVPPWTYEGLLFKRDALSGTQSMIGTAIGVPADRWKGTATTSSGDLVTRVGSANFPDQSIGILSAEVAQENRSTIKMLAYQNFGQRCAVFPDSSEAANDKANVRTGLYPIWGPLHLFIRINGTGYPANAKAGDVAGYLAGTRPAPPGLDLIRIEAQRHAVPQCAMRVRRSQEMGAAMPFAPPGACGCYYDKVANGSSSCKACLASTDCPASAPVCSYGFCEAQ